MDTILINDEIIRQLRILLPDREEGLDIVVPVSGGKDSQCCLELACTLREMGQVGSILGVFCDTQFEHPLTYSHVEWVAREYGVRVLRTESSSVEALVRKHKRFPGDGSKHCTKELKMRASGLVYRALALHYQKGFEVWYGIRSEESLERRYRYAGKDMGEVYLPDELFPSNYPKRLGRLGVRFRLPILDWSVADVLEMVGERVNPLYREGFDRVGCFPCLAGGDSGMIQAFEFGAFGARQRERVAELEKVVGRSVFRSGVGREWEGRCSICAM